MALQEVHGHIARLRFSGHVLLNARRVRERMKNIRGLHEFTQEHPFFKPKKSFPVFRRGAGH